MKKMTKSQLTWYCKYLMFMNWTIFLMFVSFVFVSVGMATSDESLPELQITGGILDFDSDTHYSTIGTYSGFANKITLSLQSADVERTLYHEMSHYWYYKCLDKSGREFWESYCEVAEFDNETYNKYDEEDRCSEKFAITSAHLLLNLDNYSLWDMNEEQLYVWGLIGECLN